MRELSETLLSQLYAANLRLGLTSEQAIESARSAVEILAETYGGQSVYIPVPVRDDRHERNQRIREMASTGMNCATIAQRFGLSARRVQQIAAQCSN